MRFTIDRIDHLVLNVASVEISAAWYQRVLGMEREDFAAQPRTAQPRTAQPRTAQPRTAQPRTALKFGGQKINLRPIDADVGSWPTGVNANPGAGDLCFITAVPPDEVIGHLHANGVSVLQGPVEKAGALGPILSVYCRDPDGNLVEIASYQPP